MHCSCGSGMPYKKCCGMSEEDYLMHMTRVAMSAKEHLFMEMVKDKMKEKWGPQIEKKADFIVNMLDEKWKMKMDMKKNNEKIWEKYKAL